MDEIIGDVNVGGMAQSAISGFAEVIVWLVAIVLVLAVIGLGWYFLSFKHRVIVREVNKGGFSTWTADKARRVKDKKGIVWFKLMKTKLKVPEPPSEVREITKKGKVVAELWVYDGKMLWKRNTFDSEKFKDTTADYLDGGFDALSSGERSMFIDEIENAQTYKKKKLYDLLWQATPIIGIIIMLTLFFIFFDNVITPGYDIAEQNARMAQSHRDMAESFEKAMRIIDDLVNERQTMGLDGTPPPN